MFYSKHWPVCKSDASTALEWWLATYSKVDISIKAISSVRTHWPLMVTQQSGVDVDVGRGAAVETCTDWTTE